MLQHLSQKYLNRLSLEDTNPDDKVSAVAGLLMEVALNDETKRDVLISWCASSSGAGVGDGVGIRRAVVAALARDREAITTVLEKSIAQFGDELYIRHSAMLQQDGNDYPHGDSSRCLLTFCSAYPNPAPCRWLRTQSFSNEIDVAHAVGHIYEHHLQSHWFHTAQSSVSWVGSWGIVVCFDR